MLLLNSTNTVRSIMTYIMYEYNSNLRASSLIADQSLSLHYDILINLT